MTAGQGPADQAAARAVPDELVERVFDLLIEQGCVPYMARVSDFTDEQVKAGALREADAEADEQNRAFCRRIVAAVADDLGAEARRECAAELRAARQWYQVADLIDRWSE